MLEGEEIKDSNYDFTFTTENSNQEAVELQILLLEKEYESLKHMHEVFLQHVQKSFIDNLKLSSDIDDHHQEFQQKNASELRAVFLQLASVSAVIVAGIMALSPATINWFIVVS